MTHKIENKDLGDGRKSVTVHVDTLNIEETDLESQEAKKVIEKEVLPKLQQQKVHVTVLHKPSNSTAQAEVALPDVRKFAEKAVQSFKEVARTQLPLHANGTKPDDFAIIEVDFDSKQVKVTSL